jgi:hypothetical protein
VLGLGAYLFLLARLDLRQLRLGREDHWIFGGALAIATLACARTTAALGATSTLTDLLPALDDATLALWAAAALWLPALLAAELIAPRVGYDARRWSTVFPLGMYAVCSIATGSISGMGGISSFGRVWIWVAFVALPARAKVSKARIEYPPRHHNMPSCTGLYGSDGTRASRVTGTRSIAPRPGSERCRWG